MIDQNMLFEDIPKALVAKDNVQSDLQHNRNYTDLFKCKTEFKYWQIQYFLCLK